MKEIEICLGLDAKKPLTPRSLAGWSPLAGVRARRQLLVAHYFDTPNHHLARGEMGLRLRRESGSWVQTFKAESTSLERLELNHRLAQRQARPRPSLSPEGLPSKDQFLALGLKRSEINELLDLQRLEEKFQVEVRRQTWALSWGRSQIELAFDQGLLRAHDQEKAFTELELELSAGQWSDLFEAAQSLSNFLESLGLQAFLEPRSKAERGFTFAASNAADAKTALKPTNKTKAAFKKAELTKEEELQPSTTSQVLSLFLQTAAHRLSQEMVRVLETIDPEGPHQARVALRQLRTIFKLLIAAGLTDPSVRLEEKASGLAEALGQLRDLDVAEEKLIRPLEAQLRFDAAVTAAAVSIAEQTSQVRDSVRGKLFSHNARSFVLEVFQFANTLKDHVGLPQAQTFANEQVALYRRRIKKRAKLEPNDENLHRLRLSYKALRYASPVLLRLGADASLSSDARKAAKAQDRLGDDHDRAVMLTTLQQALSQQDLPGHHRDRFLTLAQGFLLGRQ
jgi:triphosphatase